MANTKEVKCWTVIVLNDSTGEVLTCVQNVADPHEAMAITAREKPEIEAVVKRLKGEL